jgi:hypothetical protein
MQCGHESNGLCDGQPVCVICYDGPESPGAIEDINPPDLTNRMARCAYYGEPMNRPGTRYGCECRACSDRYRQGEKNCMCERSSLDVLGFFKYTEGEYDEFYCGCHSWD